VLDHIRDADKKQLRDREWLEEAIITAGIFPAQEIPQFLHNSGPLGICQHPNQFAPYLIALSKLGIKSYVEIGCWVGGTFSFTIEYLKHFGLKKALAVDIELQHRLKERVQEFAESGFQCEMFEASSTSPEAHKVIKAYKPDLILVDGDHTEEGCRADWEFAKDVAPWVSIHDVCGSGFPGVIKVWEEIDLPKEEWVEQYQDPPQNGMGLVDCR